LLIPVLLFTGKVFSGNLDDPWEYGNKTAEIKTEQRTGNPILKIVFLKILKFYQRNISPLDGDKCSMYPTCSAYGVDALNKHGAVLGYVMTCDRLLHEGEERNYVKKIKKFGYERYYDPVSNNDFWFNGEKK
jgi:putative membrane protein insertion efficiency factor